MTISNNNALTNAAAAQTYGIKPDNRHYLPESQRENPFQTNKALCEEFAQINPEFLEAFGITPADNSVRLLG